jgi:hypothetical protein
LNVPHRTEYQEEFGVAMCAEKRLLCQIAGNFLVIKHISNELNLGESRITYVLESSAKVLASFLNSALLPDPFLPTTMFFRFSTRRRKDSVSTKYSSRYLSFSALSFPQSISQFSYF